MTTSVVTIASTLNPVPPGDSISTNISVVLGTDGVIKEDDYIQLALTLPTGVTVANPGALNFQAQAGVQEVNIEFDVASTAAVQANSIAWTWTNGTQDAAPVNGGNFNLNVGYSTTATLVYTAAPVAPVTASRLTTAMEAVALHHPVIQQKIGVPAPSDNTVTTGGDAVRTIVFPLAYSCFQQFNGGNALPANSLTRQFYVVSTSGATASIGELIYDNGSGVGTCVVVPAIDGLTFVAAGTASFTGGTDSFTQGTYYTWNGTSWAAGSTTKAYRNAFQQNFPMSGNAQHRPFESFYTSALGGALGSVVTSTVTIA